MKSTSNILFTASQVADMLDISTTSVTRLARSGLFDVPRTGKRWKIPGKIVKEMDDYLKSGQPLPDPAPSAPIYPATHHGQDDTDLIGHVAHCEQLLQDILAALASDDDQSKQDTLAASDHV